MAELAAVQHGVVARWQLLQLGFGRGAIRALVASGALHVVHRGVYAVGHPTLTQQGRWMAAVLACGPDALLSHLSAAALYGIARARPGAIHVTAPRGRHGHSGIRLHRPRRIHPEDRAVHWWIPVVSVARLLLDNPDEKWFEETIRLRLLDVPALERALGRKPNRVLRRLLDENVYPPPDTKSDLEIEFARFCRDSGIREPGFNVLVEGHQVDAHWAATPLVVELDSRAHHATWQARERDLGRDADLALARYRVFRVTKRMLREEPGKVEALIKAYIG